MMSGITTYTDLLMEMISIPAESRHEQQRAGFLETYLRGKGFEVTRIHNNLLVGDPGKKDALPSIVLNSHMDTVPPSEGWVKDPWTPCLEGDKITGLGSNDAGASVICMIATYEQMAPSLRGQMNLLLVISAEEEISGPGGIISVLPLLGEPDGVIVGEPTGMQPAVAERGLMVLDGEVKGVAGHAARNEGENAIYNAVEDIRSITGLKFDMRSEWLPDPGAQVTMIEAGTKHNVVPDVCRYVVDVRSNDRYDNNAMLEVIRSVCQAELVPRSTRLQPSGLNRDHFLMKTVEACGMIPFGSSTLSDMALIPFPSIKLGPGDSARSHTAGEYILKSEMEAGIERYCLLLNNLKA